MGWSTNKNATEPDDSIVITKDTTLYGVWKNYITVTFNANGGYFEVYSSDDNSYTKSSTLERKVLDGTLLENIYIYAYTDDTRKARSGKYAYTANGSALDDETPVKKGDTFYVLWDDRVEVTFDANGGNLSSYYLQYFVKGKQASLNIQAYKDGQAFAGWSTDGTEKNIVYSITPSNDMSLKAVYKDGYSVTIENQDGSNGYVNAYINDSWYYSDEGDIINFIWAKDMPLSKLYITGGSYNDYIYVGLSTTSDGKNIVSGNYTPTQDTTLYAVFVPGYSVTLYPGNGSFVPDNKLYNTSNRTIRVKKGNKIGTVPVPNAPDGKIFVGWEQDDDDSNGEIITNISDIVPSGNMYYYAVYKKDIKAANITVNTSSVTYKGKAVTKAVSVKYKNLTLVKDKDYTVSYKNNNKAGTATITITGTGKYAGSVNKTFKITKGKNTLTVKTKSPKIKYSSVRKKNQTIKRAKAITVSKAIGTVTYKLTKVSKKNYKKYFSVNKKNGNITVKKGLKKGTYTLSVKVNAKGNANYNSVSKTVNVKVKVK